MNIELDIQSYSHRFQDGCFAFFNDNPTGLRIVQGSESTITLVVEGDTLEELGSDNGVYHSHIEATLFLIALNIASLGYFTWKETPSLPPTYIMDDSNLCRPKKKIALFQERNFNFIIDKILTKKEVERAVIILGALYRDSDHNSRVEYLKGLLHLGASHFDVTFYREAFGNFYRCVESFVTQRILKVKKLSNEAKDFERALKNIGGDTELLNLFKKVYKIRSNQVAHAQKKQIEFNFDDVLKAKAFADLVMHRVYIDFAEEMRKDTPLSIE